MATFPSIQADERSYAVAPSPFAEVRQLNGFAVVFQRGRTATNHSFEITFPALTRSTAELISSHYRGQRQHTPFDIPSSLWQSHASLYDVVPANQLYRYINPPSWDPTEGCLFNVTIQIQSVFVV